MNTAIIVAAGRGTRMSGGRAKQFLEIAGEPIIIHTLRAFEACADIGNIVLVLPVAATHDFLRTAHAKGIGKLSRIVAGGASRAESVRRGLHAVRAQTAEIIAVHDGVRPFVTPQEISATLAAASEYGAAVLTAPVVDTIKEIEDDFIARTPPRAALRRALTPQCFRYEILWRAYQQAGELSDAATDDSLLVENLGIRVRTVKGLSRNIKITQPEDLAVAEMLLAGKSKV